MGIGSGWEGNRLAVREDWQPSQSNIINELSGPMADEKEVGICRCTEECPHQFALNILSHPVVDINENLDINL